MTGPRKTKCSKLCHLPLCSSSTCKACWSFQGQPREPTASGGDDRCGWFVAGLCKWNGTGPASRAEGQLPGRVVLRATLESRLRSAPRKQRCLLPRQAAASGVTPTRDLRSSAKTPILVEQTIRKQPQGCLHPGRVRLLRSRCGRAPTIGSNPVHAGYRSLASARIPT